MTLTEARRKYAEAVQEMSQPGDSGGMREWRVSQAKEALDKLEAKVSRARANRKAKDEAIRSLGLTKVRGAAGGIYWE